MNNFWWPRFDGLDLGCFRLGGPGLGNLLFPWARALVGASLNNDRLIFPTWAQLKFGPYIRNESDKRHYSNIFIPDTRDIVGVEKVGRIISCKKIHESYNITIANNNIIVTEGIEGLFSPLIPHRDVLSIELYKRLSASYAKCLVIKNLNFIAVHVRLGDFSKPSSQVMANQNSNTQTPINWYVEMVKKINFFTENEYKFVVFSDGTDQELFPLLSIEGVMRAPRADAMMDILSISRCRALIGSGSTFSMWAAFLGKIPVVYFPGQLKQKVVSDLDLTELEVFSTEFTRDLCFEFLNSAID